MSQYSIVRSKHIVRQYLVVEAGANPHEEGGKIVFRGTFEECQLWIDDPLELAYQQGLQILAALEEKK